MSDPSPSPAPPPAGPPVYGPGVIAPYPLTLGDIYSAAFRTVRYNRGATLGATALAMLLPLGILIVHAAVATATGSPGLLIEDSPRSDEAGLAELIVVLAVLIVLYLVWGWGLLLASGMTAQVAMAATLGRRVSRGEAWRATRGKRRRLVGLAALVGTAYTAAVLVLVLLCFEIASLLPRGGGGLAVLVGLLGAATLVWVVIRGAYLSLDTLMLEPVGPFGALRRSWCLTRGSFWRLFGTYLLTSLIGQVVTFVVVLPLVFLAGVVAVTSGGSEQGPWADAFTMAITLGTASFFTTPFLTGVAAFQYLDLRIRREGLGQQILQATAPGAAPGKRV